MCSRLSRRNWTELERRGTMSKLSGKAGHDLFVYGSLQEPQVVYVLLNRVPDHVSAVLSALCVSLYLYLTLKSVLMLINGNSGIFSHRFRIKGRVYPTILPDGTGEVTGKVHLIALIPSFNIWKTRTRV